VTTQLQLINYIIIIIIIIIDYPFLLKEDRRTSADFLEEGKRKCTCSTNDRSQMCIELLLKSVMAIGRSEGLVLSIGIILKRI
jgi:hypothetical protein